MAIEKASTTKPVPMKPGASKPKGVTSPTPLKGKPSEKENDMETGAVIEAEDAAEVKVAPQKEEAEGVEKDPEVEAVEAEAAQAVDAVPFPEAIPTRFNLALATIINLGVSEDEVVVNTQGTKIAAKRLSSVTFDDGTYNLFNPFRLGKEDEGKGGAVREALKLGFSTVSKYNEQRVAVIDSGGKQDGLVKTFAKVLANIADKIETAALPKGDFGVIESKTEEGTVQVDPSMFYSIASWGCQSVVTEEAINTQEGVVAIKVKSPYLNVTTDYYKVITFIESVLAKIAQIKVKDEEETEEGEGAGTKILTTPVYVGIAFQSHLLMYSDVRLLMDSLLVQGGYELLTLNDTLNMVGNTHGSFIPSTKAAVKDQLFGNTEMMLIKMLT